MLASSFAVWYENGPRFGSGRLSGDRPLNEASSNGASDRCSTTLTTIFELHTISANTMLSILCGRRGRYVHVRKFKPIGTAFPQSGFTKEEVAKNLLYVEDELERWYASICFASKDNDKPSHVQPVSWNLRDNRVELRFTRILNCS